MKYLPYADRTPDGQYRALLGRIKQNGRFIPTRQGPAALTLLQQTMKFPLSNGFPVIPDRNIESFWSKGIGELCAFINGATTLSEFESFGVNWWGPWATAEKTAKRGLPTGSIGPGSYGGAFHDFPTRDGGRFDQLKHLVEQIREFPYDRTHFVSPWIPDEQARGVGKTPKTTISPCHGWVQVQVIDEQLHLIMTQRSGDVPVGVPSNMIQYAALLLMLEQLTGLEASTYYHTINNAHIYENQMDAVDEILSSGTRKSSLLREPLRFPTVELTDAGRLISDIHDFRAEHFCLSDYDAYPSIGGIPVAP